MRSRPAFGVRCKQDWLVAELGDAVDLMRAMRHALDPKDLFNPGKIFAS
jgi:D-lactate dehydrogenase (cytochrome)